MMRIVFEDGVCEDMGAELVAGRRYRLLSTPLSSSSDAKLGDIVELTSEGEIWRYEGVTDRSPLETLELLVTQEIAESSDFHNLLDSVQRSGGEWERAFGGIVLIHVPRASLADFRSRITRLVQE